MTLKHKEKDPTVKITKWRIESRDGKNFVWNRLDGLFQQKKGEQLK